MNTNNIKCLSTKNLRGSDSTVIDVKASGHLADSRPSSLTAQGVRGDTEPREGTRHQDWEEDQRQSSVGRRVTGSHMRREQGHYHRPLQPTAKGGGFVSEWGQKPLKDYEQGTNTILVTT